MKKNHAKDYLSEFASNKPEWLKALIKDAIETNGSIEELRINEIFDNLLNGTQLQGQTHNLSSAQQSSQKLLFESLTHVSGVNALCENQTIKFSTDVTVLYGLNGSGKSSYFRILNEVCGGNQKKEILPNIYALEADRKAISVEINYLQGGNHKTLNWNNSSRAFLDFNGVKVFDSSYLNGLLVSRTPDEAIVYPLGLHLFSYIAQIMDSFSEKLNQLATKERWNLPVINTENLSNDFKISFSQKQDIDIAKRNEIKGKYSFSEADDKSLLEKQSLLTNLQQTNYEDKINLLTQNNNTYSEFTEKISNTVKNLGSYSQNLKSAFYAFKSAKERNDKALLQSQILKSLPQSNTEEWKNFIKAGKEYSSKLKDEESKKCPYCHQDIVSEDALKIIEAYATFLNDTSAGELDAATENLTKVRNTINGYDVYIQVTDSIKSIVNDFKALETKLTALNDYKQSLLSAKSADDIKIFNVDFSVEKKTIQDTISKNNEELKSLNASRTKKEEAIATLQKEIVALKEKESISKQKNTIENYFNIQDKIKAIENKRNSFNTKGLTIKSNQAQNELLTSALERRLREELDKLGRKDLKVQLKVSNGSKGKCSTELVLTGNNPIKNVLSEGEQKAVGLAVFFAEIQNENFPIILDDPVTSLDHEIAGMLSKRLLDFSNQVIVFCHNRLFLDGFETSKNNHVCKNFDSCGNGSNKGKHIFIYQIYGDGAEKGILTNYKGDNSDFLIKEVNKRLSKRPFEDSYGVSILLRRAVEKIIDEEVFKHQLPPRVSNKNSRIIWKELKNINSKPDLVDRLRTVHDATSEENHVGTASSENPITVDKLKDLSDELTRIKENFKSSRDGQND